MKKGTIIFLLIIVVAIAVVPLLTIKDADFGGADGQAEEVIGEINESYVPWFEPIVGELPGEVESMLFALQAALGGLGIGYYIGKSKNNADKETQKA